MRSWVRIAEGPTEGWQREIHERLMRGDPVASAELAEALLAPLIRKLWQKYPGVPDPHLVDEAVVTAMMSYLKQPDRFDPTRSSLFRYLLLAAHRDLLNEMEKRKRRRDKEAMAVELARRRGNKTMEGAGSDWRLARVEDANRNLSLFVDTRDRAVARLILENERSTAAFAALLGLDSLPLDEQRREVKRHKDRIKKRWERKGA
jgi:RNA polymerase sigma-70 factor (ECF subfamily)